jgi:hypothetical protein
MDIVAAMECFRQQEYTKEQPPFPWPDCLILAVSGTHDKKPLPFSASC